MRVRKRFLLVSGTAAALTMTVAGDHMQPRSHSSRSSAAVFTLYVLGGSTALGEPYAPQADLGRIASMLLHTRCMGHAERRAATSQSGSAPAGERSRWAGCAKPPASSW